MDIREFCKGIRLMPEAALLIQKLELPEMVYGGMKRLFKRNREEFFRRVGREKDWELWFLYYYCRFAVEVYGIYRKNGWDEQIFWDTFSDITIWCGNCCRDFGVYGIAQYDWLYRHVELLLFRLGRLQFEKTGLDTELRSSHGILKKGSAVLNVHIPQGEPLDVDACLDSFGQAEKFFGGGIPFVCHSWLLYPGLKEILPVSSNILRFQELFEVVRADGMSREAEERIFIKKEVDASRYPAKTTLQKNARVYLMEGNRLGSGYGIRL